MPAPEELESRGALIGKVEVVVQDIFDPTDPREDKALAVLMGALYLNNTGSAAR